MVIDIPTAISAPETRFLREVARDRRVVEAGALLGYSTVLFGQVAAAVDTVDRFEGYGPSTLHACLSNLARFGVAVRVRIGDCVAHLGQMAGEVAFLDLTGDEALTRAALAALHPSVRLALVHDLGRVGCDGVERAVRTAVGWRLVEQVDTIGVLVRS